MPTDVPIGTMLPYAGKDIPAGWIACDNASYPTTTYPLLFSKIGYTYGTDDTKYRVPDTRGVFMRGMDATATRDTNRPAGSIQLSGTVPDTNSVFVGASASATGGVGYVPAPMAGQHNHVLTGNGNWVTNNSITVQNDVTGSRSIGKVYRNTTGKAMFVTCIFWTGNPTWNHLQAFSDSNSDPSTRVAYNFSDGRYITMSFWVIHNNYYKVTNDVNTASVSNWIEWY